MRTTGLFNYGRAIQRMQMVRLIERLADEREPRHATSMLGDQHQQPASRVVRLPFKVTRKARALPR